MNRRGNIIRHEIPQWLAARLSSFQIGVTSVNDLGVHGRDHMGRKSEIPWVRLYSRSLSPDAQTGWYVVYLFEALGQRVYLSLGHGSTENVRKETGVPGFRPITSLESGPLLNWARLRLTDQLEQMDRLENAMQLSARRSPLGPAYEATSLCAYSYAVEAIPDDELLTQDLQAFLGLLNTLYEGQLSDPAMPGRESLEVSGALSAIETAAGRSKVWPKGLSGPERKAVEMCAMEAAEQYLYAHGWTSVEDMSATESYDLRASNDTSEIKVEVKGTTSSGERVVLTRSEVKLHLNQFPDNALIVVSGIHLVRGESPVATGGTPFVLQPWYLDTNALEPLGYEYEVPLNLSSEAD